MKKVLLGAVCVLFLQHAMGMEKKVDDGKLTDNSSDVVSVKPRVNLEEERVKNMEIYANVRLVAEKLATFIRFFQEQAEDVTPDGDLIFENEQFKNWYNYLYQLAYQLMENVPTESFVELYSYKEAADLFSGLACLAKSKCKTAVGVECNYSLALNMTNLYKAINESCVARNEMDSFQKLVSEQLHPQLVKIAQEMYSSDAVRKILFTEVDHSKDPALNGLVECFRSKGVEIEKVLLLNPVHKGNPIIAPDNEEILQFIGCCGALSSSLFVQVNPKTSSYFDPLENVLYLGLEQLQNPAPYYSIMSIKAGQEPEKDGRFVYYLPGMLFIPNHEAGHASNDVADALYDLIATPQDKENTLRNMSAYSGGTVKVRKDLLNKGLDSVPNELFLVKEEYAVSRENISDFLETHAWEWMQGNASEKSQMLGGIFLGNCLVLNVDRNDIKNLAKVEKAQHTAITFRNDISRFAKVEKAQHTSIPFRTDHDYPDRNDGVKVTGKGFVTCMTQNPLNFVKLSNITPYQPVIDALMKIYYK